MDSIWDLANPHLRDLGVYEPGKPIEETAREIGLRSEEIIKLASNENPLGPSTRVRAAMDQAVAEANFYPDGGGFHLRSALAQRLNLAPENLILGNGSNEIIEFIGHAFLRPGAAILTSENAFVAYRLIAGLFAADTIAVPDRDYRFDLEAIADAVTPKVKVIFIANPNNPTGTMADEETIERFMSRIPDDVVVVFDEAYYEYLDHPPDNLQFVRQDRNVVVLRTFSKIHGLASARLGYGMARPELIRVLQKTREPFNVNGLVQAGALAAIDDVDHQKKTKTLTDGGRAYLQEEFRRLQIPFVPAVANFVLAKVGDGKAVFEKMLRAGIIVRPMNGYPLPEWVRISVGTMEQNERCIEVLRKVLRA
jgi:histidinol-phosphate aminotransferase